MNLRRRRGQLRAASAIALDDTELQLRREELFDRRWARHRDQILTVTGIVGVALAAVLGIPALGLVGALPAGPRAAKWVLERLP
jgi:hypothetical protein